MGPIGGGLLLLLLAGVGGLVVADALEGELVFALFDGGVGEEGVGLEGGLEVIETTVGAEELLLHSAIALLITFIHSSNSLLLDAARNTIFAPCCNTKQNLR